MKIGDLVPDFSLPDQDWNVVHSKDLIGEPFVIFFYPKDDTPGCTKQACAFRDHFGEFEEKGVRVIGISADNPESHREFKSKNNLPFSLLSDKNKDVLKAFNVSSNLFGLLPGRATYIFDEHGVLIHSFRSQLNMEKHVEESLQALNES